MSIRTSGVIGNFTLSRLPAIEFGEGVHTHVAGLAASFGRRALLITGARSFRDSNYWESFAASLRRERIVCDELRVNGEPSPRMVDDAVRAFGRSSISVVIGVGGGSVLDAAKAIAGLLPHGNSVMDHLEGVGPEQPYLGPATPFIAVPTTAGTGSEATKNAVLSVQGANGFKKSFRHDQLVPRYAVVDPLLLSGCPPALIAANGMDALTQLLESYVSSRANPFTDALAVSGMEAVSNGLLEWYREGPLAAQARSQMAYAALLSGITLAQVGLGSVHGLASPLGAMFPIPHGVVCGTLVAAATEMNIRVMSAREPENKALDKYAHAGRLLGGVPEAAREEAWQLLVQTLARWTEQLGLPRLGAYGVREADLAPVVANCRGSSMKTNPVVLTDDEVLAVLRQRL